MAVPNTFRVSMGSLKGVGRPSSGISLKVFNTASFNTS